jgi:hypothetical protein
MDAEAIIISSEYIILVSAPAKKIIEFAAVAETISPSNNRLGVMRVSATSVVTGCSIRNLHHFCLQIYYQAITVADYIGRLSSIKKCRISTTGGYYYAAFLLSKNFEMQFL